MSIFAVLSPTENSKLESSITENFPADSYKITSTQWLVSAKLTAKQLSDKLGVTENGKKGPSSIGSALILSISGYYGVANTDIWEWIGTKWEERDG